MSELELGGYTPGAIGWVTQLHGEYYAQHWELGLYFEAKVATELSAFLNRLDPATDGAWFARWNGKFAGAIFIDGHDPLGPRLRWFIVAPEYHGKGVGSSLMDTAMSFCKQAGFKRVYLTTFAGLKTARHLYDKHGFRVCHEEDASELTGKASLVEQVLEVFLNE